MQIYKRYAKKMIIAAVCFMLFFCSCGKNAVNVATTAAFSSYDISETAVLTATASASASTAKNVSTAAPTTKEYNGVTINGNVKGIWISYYDVDYYDGNITRFITAFDAMMKNVKSLGFNAVFVHVRAYSDAIYPSKIYPWSSYVTGIQGKNPGFDPLKIMIKLAHNHSLQFHAWINPFRIAKDQDITKLSDDNFAKKCLTDADKSNDNYVKLVAGGIYYNPSAQYVRNMVVDGVREIAQNYDVDGIHLDDYFYPVTDESLDESEYAKYCENGKNPLSLSGFRRHCIDEMVSAIYRTVKGINKKIVFGISPQANMANNYNTLYADVRKWCTLSGFVDYIAPQIYFGFLFDKNNGSGQNMAFDKCAEYWNRLVTNKNVKLYFGLGLYRSGTEIEFEGKAKTEWIDNDDVIKRQIICASKLKKYGGIIVFTYSSLSVNENAKKETANFSKLLTESK